MKRIQIIAIASLLASLASAAERGRTQHLSSPNQVPQGLNAAAWSNILLQEVPAIAQQAYLKASNTGPDDNFGWPVAVSGDTVVVGAPLEDGSATGVSGDQSDNRATNSGAAYVFVRSRMSWLQQAYFKASNAEANDEFGRSVAVSGDTVVVGAINESSNATGVNGNQSDNRAAFSGVAYVFVRNGTNWIQQAYLKASNTGPGDNFGWSVAVSGDTAVVGAPRERSSATGVNGDQGDNSALAAGAAYVFVRDGTNWTQQAYLKASNTAASDFFGWSVAVSGDTVVVGAYREDSNATGINGTGSDPNMFFDSGAAYVFVRNGTTWSQQAYVKASNTGFFDRFGMSVAVSADTLVVGADGETSDANGVNGDQSDNSVDSVGAAYVFVRSGTNWTQQAYLKASNSERRDQFGFSVAVLGDVVVVGAPSEDSDATGVNGNQSDNSASYAGAAYVFVRGGTTWTQQAYLKASNTGESDGFGVSVAVSSDLAIVGAYLEDSNTTGVNANQSDNSATNSGAAYVFTGLGLGTQLAIVPDGSSGYFTRFRGAPDVTYRLQRAPGVTGPWDTIATQTPPASGLVEFHETNPPVEGAFYRTAQP